MAASRSAKNVQAMWVTREHYSRLKTNTIWSVQIKAIPFELLKYTYMINQDRHSNKQRKRFEHLSESRTHTPVHK